MKDLSKYRQFERKKSNSKTNEKPSNKNVWLYTRVSSSAQKDNYSLEYQNDEANKYAEKHGYIITQRFGNKNESASSDISRKEFNELINRVRSSKDKPFAIMVYAMNRFSRTGGSAISIANELVQKTGVFLIEITSGIDSSTSFGQNQIYRKLIEAKEQNDERLKHTLPGMKKHVQSGKCLGAAPKGYDMYGPRVKDFTKRAVEQKIILNDEGKKLRLAWQWKSEGMMDYEIIEKLRSLGLIIRKQTLSAMWRRPFYTGLQMNSLLEGKYIEGNWEPMVTEDVFWKVQSIISGNNQGYEIAKEVDDRPLIGLLFCPKCGKKLTGYMNNKRKLHYYKCQTCKDVSINAHTPIKKYPNHFGANDLFVQLLSLYHIKPEFENIFKLQVNKMLTNFTDSTKSEETLYKKQLTELTKNRENLDERYGYGQIEKDLYEKLKTKNEDAIRNLETKYKIPEIEVSNIEISLNKTFEFTQNINKYWISSNVGNKRRIQNLLFPSGLIIDTENRQYLTSKINALFELKQEFMSLTEDEKKRLPIKIDEESSVVAGTGLEPASASRRI